jgi:hypothetical protein
MFLPVLMLRDYGAWGWFVFAVPNVVGAAAMGWVLRDRDASRAVQQAHLPACRWFSIVTVAFHAYFVLALLPRLIGDSFITLAASMLLLTAVMYGPRGRRATLTGSLALAVSVLAMLAVLALRGIPELPPPAKDQTDLVWLFPVTAFGFLLAPYLDLTFHKARQSTTRAGGRTAFGLGFGVFFLLMIVFTALYAPSLMAALAGERRFSIRTDLFAAVLGVHFAVQAAFTVVAHTDSVHEAAGASVHWLKTTAGAVAIVGLALALRWVAQRYPVYHGFRGQTLATIELIYRVFMAFYGLVFPAYVWLFMVPALRRRRPVAVRPPRGGILIYFAAVVALAAPFFWMGFIEGQMKWLVPGLVPVLLARFLVPKGSLAPESPPAR